jgi:hypothetical protein
VGGGPRPARLLEGRVPNALAPRRPALLVVRATVLSEAKN